MSPQLGLTEKWPQRPFSASTDKPSSFSGLDLFTLCERKYFYAKIQGLPEPEGAPLIVGSSYHQALADMWSDPKRSVAELAVVRVALDAEKLAAVGVDVAALEWEMTQNIERLVKLLYTLDGCRPTMHEGVPLIECRFDSPDLGYRGVVDVVTDKMPLTDSAGRVVGFCDEPGVLDYKVVTSDRRRSERDARFSTQLALYCLVMGVTRAAYVEIPRNVLKPIQVRGASFSVVELDSARRYLLEGRAAMQSRGTDILHYKRTERDNPLCSVQFCPFFGKCYGL